MPSCVWLAGVFRKVLQSPLSMTNAVFCCSSGFFCFHRFLQTRMNNRRVMWITFCRETMAEAAAAAQLWWHSNRWWTRRTRGGNGGPGHRRQGSRKGSRQGSRQGSPDASISAIHDLISRPLQGRNLNGRTDDRAAAVDFRAQSQTSEFSGRETAIEGPGKHQ